MLISNVRSIYYSDYSTYYSEYYTYRLSVTISLSL